MKINVLGTGGAFDVKEGNSSFIVTHNDKNFLIDCGYDVYPKLMQNNLVDDVDYVCITHCHDDHIGSLSAFLYYSFYIKKKVIGIYTSEAVSNHLWKILAYMGMTMNEHYRFYCYDDIKYIRPKDLLSVEIIDTTGLHVDGMPSCSFVFDNKLIISGDISVNFLTANQRALELFTNGAVLFHDACDYSCPVHCFHEKITDIDRNNLYLYHHSEKTGLVLNDNGFKTLKTGIIEL